MRNATFHDAHSAILAHPALTPTEIFLRAVAVTPLWVGGLMAMRNRAAKLIGLKDVGRFSDAADKPAAFYAVGDKLGIFNILSSGERELVVGVDDSHLDVRVSVLKTDARELPVRCVVSTVVTVHNWLGHVYMASVRPVHPGVVRAVMRRVDI